MMESTGERAVWKVPGHFDSRIPRVDNGRYSLGLLSFPNTPSWVIEHSLLAIRAGSCSKPDYL